MYHPQKRTGFGFIDGEGCERCWASLQKLIPGLRVSGVSKLTFACSISLTQRQYHRRLFILDQRLAHLNQVNLFLLGKWWRRKKESLERKQTQALGDLKQCGVSLVGLRTQWLRQQFDVTAKLPSMLLFIGPHRLC